MGIGIVCVRKPDQACDLCCACKMKCEWPSKSAKPSTSMSLPTRDWPIVLVPAPKWESLEVCCQEITVQEWVNELAEAHLEVDHKMVIAMQNLTDAMGCLGVGSLTCSGTGGVSVGMDWPGECEGTSALDKGKGRAVEEGDIVDGDRVDDGGGWDVGEGGGG